MRYTHEDVKRNEFKPVIALVTCWCMIGVRRNEKRPERMPSDMFAEAVGRLSEDCDKNQREMEMPSIDKSRRKQSGMEESLYLI